MKKNFPLPHIVDAGEKVVWVALKSAITGMGIQALARKYYPGFKVKIASPEQLSELTQRVPKEQNTKFQ